MPLWLMLLWSSPRFLHIIIVHVHNIMHPSKGILVKESVIGTLEQWIHDNIASCLPNDVADMHALRDGLHIAPNYLDQVLKNQSQ